MQYTRSLRQAANEKQSRGVLKTFIRTMVKRHKIQGYEEFCKFFDCYKDDGNKVHVYYGGSKLPNGDSWCSYCVRAIPIIEATLSKADEDSVFVYVEVGDYAFWKDPKCPFRTDKRTKLLQLPTLVRWGCPQRLEGTKCENPDLVEMLFTDD